MKGNSGFSLVEIIIAIGLAAIFLPAIGLILSFALKTSSQGEKFSQAHSLCQEGMEAIFFLKSYQPSFWELERSNEKYYQLTKTDGHWQLEGPFELNVLPSISHAPFTQTVIITNAYRCLQAEQWVICDQDEIGSTLNEFTRKIIVDVSWPEEGQKKEVKLETYVTQH